MDIVQAAVTTDAELTVAVGAAKERIVKPNAIETAVEAVHACYSARDNVLIRYGRIDRALYYLLTLDLFAEICDIPDA